MKIKHAEFAKSNYVIKRSQFILIRFGDTTYTYIVHSDVLTCLNSCGGRYLLQKVLGEDFKDKIAWIYDDYPGDYTWPMFNDIEAVGRVLEKLELRGCEILIK